MSAKEAGAVGERWWLCDVKCHSVRVDSSAGSYACVLGKVVSEPQSHSRNIA